MALWIMAKFVPPSSLQLNSPVFLPVSSRPCGGGSFCSYRRIPRVRFLVFPFLLFVFPVPESHALSLSAPTQVAMEPKDAVVALRAPAFKLTT